MLEFIKNIFVNKMVKVILPILVIILFGCSKTSEPTIDESFGNHYNSELENEYNNNKPDCKFDNDGNLWIRTGSFNGPGEGITIMFANGNSTEHYETYGFAGAYGGHVDTYEIDINGRKRREEVKNDMNGNGGGEVAKKVRAMLKKYNELEDCYNKNGSEGSKNRKFGCSKKDENDIGAGKGLFGCTHKNDNDKKTFGCTHRVNDTGRSLFGCSNINSQSENSSFGCSNKYIEFFGKFKNGSFGRFGYFGDTEPSISDLEKDLQDSIKKKAIEPDTWYVTDKGIWYYFENDRTTKKKGWFIDPQDNQTYFLDRNTGVMAVGWTVIDGGLYYFNEEHAVVPNWYYEAGSDTWQSKGANVKSYGSIFRNEITPDGSIVDANGRKVETGVITGDYIIPDSNVRLLTREELYKFSKEQLTLAYNEIYARHGRKFNNEAIYNYFLTKPWYNGTIEANNFNPYVLSDIEAANVTLI